MGRPQRLLAFLALGAALVVTGVLISSARRGPDYRLSFVIPNAANLIPGLYIRAAGQRIGEITKVQTTHGDRKALIQISITDSKVWPLPPDTKFVIRFGGTVAYAARYIQIERGTSSAPPFPDGATLPTSAVVVPVEFNSVFNTFDPHTRADLKATVDTAGPAVTAAGPNLRSALNTAPAAVGEAQSLFGSLGANEQALDTLVRSTSDVVGAANSANPGVASLIANASTTFQAIGGQAGQLEQALSELPVTLTRTRATLARLDVTLNAATELTSRLSPGVTQLSEITPALNNTLTTLTSVGPDAVSTLATVRHKAPDITGLLDQATQLMPQIGSLGSQAATQLACIRPYSPEIAGFASTWDSFVADGDPKDKYARLYFGTYPYTNATPLSVPQVAKINPNSFLDWAFPRPPGENVHQPWFIPSCGITPAALDPQQDPEARTFDPLSQTLLSFSGASAPR